MKLDSTELDKRLDCVFRSASLMGRSGSTPWRRWQGGLLCHLEFPHCQGREGRMRSSPPPRLTRVGRAGRAEAWRPQQVPSPHLPRTSPADHWEKGPLGMPIRGGSEALKCTLLPFKTYSCDSSSYSLWKVWEVTENLEHKAKPP